MNTKQTIRDQIKVRAEAIITEERQWTRDCRIVHARFKIKHTEGIEQMAWEAVLERYTGDST